jgi:uncharacterized membrane-anchored protein
MRFLAISNYPIELWNKLAKLDLVQGKMPASKLENSVWYIRALQGFAGWIASFFLLGFFATFFSWIFERENAALIILIGCLLNGLSFVIGRTLKEGEFVRQLGLAINLCGQLIFAWGIYEWLGSTSATFFLILLSYQCVIVFIIPQFVSRVISSWFAMIALFFCFGRLGIFNVSAAIASALFVIVWSFDFNWKGSKTLWEPIGFGLALSLLQFNGQLLFGEGVGDWFSKQSISWLADLSPVVSELIIACLLLFILLGIVRLYHLSWNSLAAKLIVICGGLLLLVNHFVIGSSAGILLILIGFIKQRKLLVAIGVVALLGFVSWYYYHLDMTLLAKSITLIIFSSAFFASYFLVNRMTSDDSLSFSEITQRYKMNSTKWLVVLTIGIALSLVNWDIAKKEEILSEGRVVLLKLAPVDPRSLMQGDYMNLRFEIENVLIQSSSKDNSDPAFGFDQSNDEGQMIVDLDDNQVGTLAEQQSFAEIDDQQVIMRFKIRHNRLRLATHAFFFQEGTAADYEKAKYGEFRVAPNGELLLNNLRDESFKIVGYYRPTN